MELAELLEREGYDPEALLPWARERAVTLLAGLAEIDDEDPLLALLDAGVEVSLDALAEVRSSPLGVPFTPLTEPSGLQPMADLPPPPEPVARGPEPEPLLATFDTGPHELGEPPSSPTMDTARTEVVASPTEQTVIIEVPSSPVEQTVVSEIPFSADHARAPEDDEDDEELEELELDELVELDAEELEVLDEDGEDGEDGEADSAPVRSGDTATGLPIVAAEAGDEAPVRSGDTATGLPILDAEAHDAVPVRTGDTAAHPIVSDAVPVRTGDTAAHPILADEEPEEVDLDAPRSGAGEDDFELDFDE